jgi:hypothetical protein
MSTIIPLHHSPQDGHPLIDGPEGLTPAWLTSVLRKQGWLRQASVTAAVTKPIGNGLIGLNLRITLSYDREEPGAPATLVAKLAAAGEASRASGAGLGLYERETRFYQNIAPKLGAALPQVLFADISEDKRTFCLLFEDLAPARMGDQLAGCSVADAEAAIDTAADIHAPMWGLDHDRLFPWLHREQMVSLYVGHFPPSVEMVKGRYQQLLEPGVIEVAEAFARKIKAYFEQLDGPFTIAHHDYRLDNQLFDARGGKTPCAVLDWQTLMPGPGPLDVSYFNGAGLLPELRREHEQRLARRYHTRLLANGVTGYSWERCWHDYRFTAAHGFIMGVVGAAIATPTERGDKMLSTMINRHSGQVIDLGTLDLIR